MLRLLQIIGIAVLLSLVGREAWGWLRPVSRAVIRLSTLLLQGDRRNVERKRLLGQLRDRFDDRRLSGLAWSIGVALACLWVGAARLVRAGVHGAGTVAGRWSRQLARPYAGITRGIVAASTGLIAISASLAAYDMLRIPLSLALGLGIGLGLLVATVDMTMSPAVTGRRGIEVALALAPRLTMALVLSVLLATPMVMRILPEEIATQLASDRAVATQKAHSHIAEAARPTVERIERRRAAVLQAPNHNSSSRAARRELQLLDAELHAVTAGVDHDKRAAERSAASRFNGIVGQLIALQELRSAGPGLSYLIWMMQALFFLIYALPSFVTLTGPWRRVDPAAI